MADGELRDEIARIEGDIEQLAQAFERCRKAMALAKVAIAAGAIWISAYFLGAIWFEPATMIGALAAIIGGVVVFGSNSSTSKQTTTAIKAAEAQRAEARAQEAAPDDMINFRAVGSSRVVGL